ncbi:MAG: hypothetical protein ACKO0M_18205 [Cyanobium sp.]
MTGAQRPPFHLPAWIAACAAGALLQVWGDGIALWIAAMQAGGLGVAGLTTLGLITASRLISGALAGLLQGLALSRRRAWIVRWLIATGLGAGVSFLVINLLVVQSLEPLSEHPLFAELLAGRSPVPLALMAATGGLILGAVQGFALRRPLIQAGWWVLCSGIGLLGASLAEALVQRGLAGTGLPVAAGNWNPLAWLVAGASMVVYALITGLFWRGLSPADPPH